ncbi:MAG: bifunctional 3-(3-hydroxy-phenyl)propionate/3-hydroxycinnamic acid hydroxylase [Solirubrobacteraceae bacterium]|nr:bifunctional 3-(3-hydroxy-phenyl)propionate/3-hydroxycinnamic acid hydroxylase [Solirubrobacteraceae bacterium]
MANHPVMDCDVLIVGLGPVGQLLANLLGAQGIDVVALDEALAPYDLPRAAVIDDEVLRILQSAGLAEGVLADAQVQRTVSYRTRAGRPVEIMRPESGPYGHPPLVSINQPSVERTLIAGLDRFPCVDARWGQRVEHIDQRADHATVWVRPNDGGRCEELKARWVVACDGSRSAVRAMLGVGFGGSTFRQRWLVVDALTDQPVLGAPHPTFLGDPIRPTVSLPMSPGRHRWEWMLHPGEAAEPLLAPESIQARIAEWTDDPDLSIERSVVYTFHARNASRWRVGRFLLAGDAAHVMPPFIGQGFSSGARDAANLSWKLGAVLSGAPQSLLDTYEAERRRHVTTMQQLAVRWGKVLQTTNPQAAAVRDVVLTALDRVGVVAAVRDRIKPTATIHGGAFAQRTARLPWRRAVGTLLPQPLALEADGGEPRLLDDCLPPGWVLVTTSAEVAGVDAGFAARLIPMDLDEGGELTSWMQARRVDWVVLRPDRYVFAAGTGVAGVPRAAAAMQRLAGTGGTLMPLPQLAALAGGVAS